MSLGWHSTRETPRTSPGRGSLGRTRWGTGHLSLPSRQETASAPQTSQDATRGAWPRRSQLHQPCPLCQSLHLCHLKPSIYGWVFVAEDPQPIPKCPMKGTTVSWPVSVSGTCYVPGPGTQADSLMEGHTSAKSGEGDSVILTGSCVVREGWLFKLRS